MIDESNGLKLQKFENLSHQYSLRQRQPICQRYYLNCLSSNWSRAHFIFFSSYQMHASFLNCYRIAITKSPSGAESNWFRSYPGLRLPKIMKYYEIYQFTNNLTICPKFQMAYIATYLRYKDIHHQLSHEFPKIVFINKMC